MNGNIFANFSQKRRRTAVFYRLQMPKNWHRRKGAKDGNYS
nr:MAG TPA: hypothetical protein [Caudoviricetes sp.]